MKTGFILSGLLLFSATARAEEAPAEPPRKVALGVNVLQPLIYGVSSSFFQAGSYIPVPIEAHVSFGPRWGFAGTFQYVHQNDGTMNLNGLTLVGGPRYQITGQGLTGFYATFKAGIGFLTGVDAESYHYNRVFVALQPEIGYALAWKAFFLAFGAGAQFQATFVEDKQSSNWVWNGLGQMLATCVPVVNITPGITF